MTAPNVNVLWGRIVADEVAKAGVDAVCLCPGSRSTPLTVAFAEHPDVETVSQLDERSAAFFALGRAKRTGRPTPLVCTSGTAAANFHPAVIEADRFRVPMLLLTADRPPELWDSGANQTIDQERLYGDAVRAYRTLPEPEATDRKLRSLRTAVARGVGTAGGTPPGPVHLDVPFRKPLEPTVETDEPPAGFAAEHPLAVEGRAGPFVRTAAGRPSLDGADRDDLFRAVEAAGGRGLVVCGPADAPTPERAALLELAAATGFPVVADPLSGARFGPHVEDDRVTVLGGYDSWVPALEAAAGDRQEDGDGGDDRLPTPEVVVRFGASPTSKPLRKALARWDARQFVVDPAGGWREAGFTATDLVVADPTGLAHTVAEGIETRPSGEPAWYRDRLATIERDYWELIERADAFWEGRVLGDVAKLAPDPATVVVSNSMPVRDLDRFGQPRTAALTVLGNRGASGIDGVTSTALGAGSTCEEPLVLVTGDLAYYHDMNGLAAVDRCGVDATIVVVNNDGGGIFHRLPIADHDTFEEQFLTPHGLDFAPTGDLYGFEFAREDDRGAFRAAFVDSVGSDGTQVIEVPFDAAASHAVRDELQARVAAELTPPE
jgi:2-succinyl-5-enolpyruvyl-6-hydroxy-3-cyclohexene-1-carboxylate synthase